MAKTLDELEQDYRRWREQVAHRYDAHLVASPAVPFHQRALLSLGRELSEAFLRGDRGDRKWLKELVSDKDGFWLLTGLPLLLAKSIKQPSDRQNASLGLIALLMVHESGMDDQRGIFHSTRTLLTAAAAAGIDHVGLLQELQEIAEDEAATSFLDKWSKWKPVLPKPPFRLEDEIAKSAEEIAQGARAWFYQGSDGASVGPLTTRSLRECRYRGVITAKTMVREATNPEAAWKTASEFQEIVPRIVD